MKNQLLELELIRIMDRANSGHYHCTSKQHSLYYDENTLFVVFNQIFDDGINEKKYSLLLMLTPAGMKTISSTIYYLESESFECFDSFIIKILDVEKHENRFKVKVKMASGKEKIFES